MGSVLWTSEEVKLATGGDVASSWDVRGVTIDSRSVKEGDLFIALVGENFDGHDFVQQALDCGAVAAIVAYVPENVSSDDDKLVVVDDTMDALYDLARYSRHRVQGKVIAVTGSVGKTSVKEMLACALEHQGMVYATEGNLNNHYGLPLTLCRVHADVDYVVVEMGMNHAGEISPLSVLASPDVAVITNVAAVHLEFFDSVEGIAAAKAEIFDGLSEDGVAVLNQDNEYYLFLKNKAIDGGIKNIVSFGKSGGADYKLVDYRVDVSGCEISARSVVGSMSYKLSGQGEHWAVNSLGVLAAIGAVNADVLQAAAALQHYVVEGGRGKQIRVEGNCGSIVVIDDTYNASPVSVVAALKSLPDIKNQFGKRVIVVLGDMLELGECSKQMHLDIGQNIIANDVDLVFTAGDMMRRMCEALPTKMQGAMRGDAISLCNDVCGVLQDGDVVLVKGSRGMHMENVVQSIKERC